MTTRRIALPLPECKHPDHMPPSGTRLEPGTYQHICDGCGQSMIFTVAESPTC